MKNTIHSLFNSLFSSSKENRLVFQHKGGPNVQAQPAASAEEAKKLDKQKQQQQPPQAPKETPQETAKKAYNSLTTEINKWLSDPLQSEEFKDNLRKDYKALEDKYKNLPQGITEKDANEFKNSIDKQLKELTAKANELKKQQIEKRSAELEKDKKIFTLKAFKAKIVEKLANAPQGMKEAIADVFAPHIHKLATEELAKIEKAIDEAKKMDFADAGKVNAKLLAIDELLKYQDVSKIANDAMANFNERLKLIPALKAINKLLALGKSDEKAPTQCGKAKQEMIDAALKALKEDKDFKPEEYKELILMGHLADLLNEKLEDVKNVLLTFDPGKYEQGEYENDKTSEIIEKIKKLGKSALEKEGIKIDFIGGTDGDVHRIPLRMSWHKEKADALKNMLSYFKDNEKGAFVSKGKVEIVPPEKTGFLYDNKDKVDAYLKLVEAVKGNRDQKVINYVLRNKKVFLPGGTLFDMALAFQRAEYMKKILTTDDSKLNSNEDIIRLELGTKIAEKSRKGSIRLSAIEKTAEQEMKEMEKGQKTPKLAAPAAGPAKAPVVPKAAPAPAPKAAPAPAAAPAKAAGPAKAPVVPKAAPAPGPTTAPAAGPTTAPAPGPAPAETQPVPEITPSLPKAIDKIARIEDYQRSAVEGVEKSFGGSGWTKFQDNFEEGMNNAGESLVRKKIDDQHIYWKFENGTWQILGRDGTPKEKAQEKLEKIYLQAEKALKSAKEKLEQAKVSLKEAQAQREQVEGRLKKAQKKVQIGGDEVHAADEEEKDTWLAEVEKASREEAEIKIQKEEVLDKVRKAQTEVEIAEKQVSETEQQTKKAWEELEKIKK